MWWSVLYINNCIWAVAIRRAVISWLSKQRERALGKASIFRSDKTMGKEKHRLRLYWLINANAISPLCIGVLLLSMLLPRYLPWKIVAPSAFLCSLGALAYGDRFYALIGWDKERIPVKSIEKFWNLIIIVQLFLFVLWVNLIGLPDDI